MATSGGKEVNYWPGFVDALTNTVIAMVFVVIVLTLSLSVFINAIANQRAAKMVQDKIDEAKGGAPAVAPAAAVSSEASSSSTTPPSTPLNASILKGEFRVAENSKTLSQENIKPKLDTAANALLVYFPGTTVEVDNKTELELERLATNSGLAFEQLQAVIVARGPQIFLSDNQRLAFFRAMSVRNFLMKKDMLRDNIKIRIEEAPGTTEGVVVVSIRKAGTP